MKSLPAQPALELGPSQPIKLSAPVLASAQGNVYRAPANFQSNDLAEPGKPPAALGAFYPKA